VRRKNKKRGEEEDEERRCACHRLKLFSALFAPTYSTYIHTHTHTHILQRVEEVAGGPSGRKED
jgi:hypothetical protein